MDLKDMVATKALAEIASLFPVSLDFFINYNLLHLPQELTLECALEYADETCLMEFGLDKQGLADHLVHFLQAMENDRQSCERIRSITILGGHNKLGEREDFSLSVSAGDIISIVGPTGSGKSRLLGDIECLAQGDTPTGRRILVNGRALSAEERFGMDGKLVAQLSQNMNFVMDVSIAEFLDMHARSRRCENVEDAVQKCFACANELAGEKFTLDTKVTQLSGGQSRALMIADTSYISSSPIILIDEIENAGIDKRRAISMLTKNEKIVLISTHDPLLALRAHKRIVIHNGGVSRIIETSRAERESLSEIERLDSTILAIRRLLREGKLITVDTL